MFDEQRNYYWKNILHLENDTLYLCLMQIISKIYLMNKEVIIERKFCIVIGCNVVCLQNVLSIIISLFIKHILDMICIRRKYNLPDAKCSFNNNLFVHQTYFRNDLHSTYAQV